MSSKKLSAVLEKKIRRLCLTDFPCGNGTWRGTKDSAGGAETESTDGLLDLLDCPRSPWRLNDDSWSPQASVLRRLAVLEPRRLNANFIYNYFTTLRILGKDVSIIDEGLLRFSKLEELVVSTNVISEIPAENLPGSMKVLDVRANRLSSLNGLTKQPPPQLQYLSLGSNCLGSHKDISHLTGRHWPLLVCLDLSDCEFQDQQALLSALSTLPCLKTLLVGGNPFTLAPSYPGFTVDSLPQLTYLDASWISVEDRCRFRGLASMSDLIVDVASVTVSLSRLMGIPDPLMGVNKKTPEFPLITYSYFITYQFLNHPPPDKLKLDSEFQPAPESTARVTEDGPTEDDQQTIREGETSSSDAGVSSSDETPTGSEHLLRQQHTSSGKQAVGEEREWGDEVHPLSVSQHSTSKLLWTELVDFSDSQTFTVSSLRVLKKFFNQGLSLRLKEEKILSWPAASEDALAVKPRRPEIGRKGKKEESSAKSTKDKPKDKKSKSAPDLVQDAPIRRTLGSAHVPLQSLVHGGQKVNVICDFGPLHTDNEEDKQTRQKELGKKIKEEKKEDKDLKQRGDRSTVPSKGKGKKAQRHDVDVHTDKAAPIQPVTMELCVELEKWRSASEAHQLKPPQ